MALVKFNYCIQSVYDTLQTPRDLDSLYFVTDTRRIYKGDLLLSSDTAEFVTEIPEFDQAQSNKLYIFTNGTAASIYVKGTDTMVEVAGGTLKPGAITNINIFNPDMVTLSSELESGNLPQNDTTLPTSGAVRTAIETAIESIDLSAYDEAFTNVSASGKVYKGGQPVTESIVVSDTLPEISTAIKNKLYINSQTLESKITINGTTWVDLSPGYITDGGNWAESTNDAKIGTISVIKEIITQALATIDINSKIDKVESAVVDNVPTLTAEGGIKDSGKSIGGSTLSESPNSNTLATEAAIADALSWKKYKLSERIELYA